MKPKSAQETIKLIKSRLQNVKFKIPVISGKGGVGKSMVSASLSLYLAKMGHKVAILDADIHGPSIPNMLGVKGRMIYGVDGIIPLSASNGVKVVSSAFLLPDERTPIIWRGPLKSNLILQLLEEVHWGHLDFLIVDLPPGTGDEALSIAQFIPDVTGDVIVTIPSQISWSVVKKAIEFSHTLNMRILGVVENMAWVKCPKCGEKIWIFGDSLQNLVEEEGIKYLGSIPLDPNLSSACDKGQLHFILEDTDYLQVMKPIVDNILASFEP
ncbi:ATP-binding protein [Candidatus Bathyarchaeota archaeon ex4484_205]|nr:MAG: ATP-binding protein [Candidatus Bathyarchaeota archaeon ex4484_205]RLG68307.1 MAG: ATP-binding protein [archaeon]